MKKKEKVLVAGIGAASAGAAGFALSTYFVTKALIRVALVRSDGKRTRRRSRDRLRGFRDSEEILQLIERGKTYLEEAKTQEVSLTSFDGTELVGHLFAVENPRRLIIAMHGWRSSWSENFGGIAPFLHENGCSVLYCEQRAHGRSGGKFMGFGLLERFDCVEWVKWAKANLPDLPLYLAGVSMGGATVLMAASLGIEGDVCGIIADCGYTSPGAIWRHVVTHNLHLPYPKMAGPLCRKIISMGPEDVSTVTALSESKIPILLIHGSGDTFVPIEMTYENFRACAGPRRLLVVPGADHCTSYAVGMEDYEKTLLSFFGEFDRN